MDDPFKNIAREFKILALPFKTFRQVVKSFRQTFKTLRDPFKISVKPFLLSTKGFGHLTIAFSLFSGVQSKLCQVVVVTRLGKLYGALPRRCLRNAIKNLYGETQCGTRRFLLRNHDLNTDDGES